MLATEDYTEPDDGKVLIEMEENDIQPINKSLYENSITLTIDIFDSKCGVLQIININLL